MNLIIGLLIGWLIGSVFLGIFIGKGICWANGSKPLPKKRPF